MPFWGQIMKVRNSQKLAGFQEIPEDVRQAPIHSVHKNWRKFDDTYLRKWFIKEDALKAKIQEEEALKAQYQVREA